MTTRHDVDAVFHRSKRLLDTIMLSAILLLVGGISAGCGHDSTPPPSDVDPALALEQAFSTHAARVLHGSQAFVGSAGGFAVPLEGEPAQAVARRGGLSAALPKRGEESVRFHALSGLEIRVRESGASGEGRLARGAVAYRRKGGTSFWTATEEGYEEWLMLDRGVATGREPVATWEVEGATVREGAGAVEIAGADGVVQIRVRAPAAFAQSGASVPVRLSARGSSIELWADSGGEPVLVDPVWSTTTSMTGARRDHTAVVLSSSGKLLVAGGYTGSAYLGTAQLYDPVAATWSSAGSLATPRGSHKAVLLGNGKVLVTGGQDASGALSSVELYDPTGNSWSTVTAMTYSRYDHSATLLDDGRVLVAGGQGASAYLNTAEIYNPSTDVWSSAGTMSLARKGHTATPLAGGSKILIAGGQIGATSYTNYAQVYDRASGTWGTAVTMPARRAYHSATLLANGNVLLAGGMSASSTYLSSAVLYDASSGTWSSVALMSGARAHHAAELVSGKVLVTGGLDGAGSYLSSDHGDLRSVREHVGIGGIAAPSTFGPHGVVAFEWRAFHRAHRRWVWW